MIAIQTYQTPEHHKSALTEEYKIFWGKKTCSVFSNGTPNHEYGPKSTNAEQWGSYVYTVLVLAPKNVDVAYHVPVVKVAHCTQYKYEQS